MDAKEIVKWIKEREIQAVDLRFCDLPGLWQHFSVHPRGITEEAFEEGYGFDGSSIPTSHQLQARDRGATGRAFLRSVHEHGKKERSCPNTRTLHAGA